MFLGTRRFSYTLLIVLFSAATSVHAQERTVADGVFTEAQVESGKGVYESTCSACHRMREYRQVLRAFQNNSVMVLWDMLVSSMPADNPGSLADSEYTDIIAYILSEQGYPAGDTPLDPYNGMDEIKIIAP